MIMTFKLVIWSADSGVSGMGQQSEASYYKETTIPEERMKYMEHKINFDNVQRDVSKEVLEKLSKQNKAELQSTSIEDGEIGEDGEVGTTDEELEPNQIEEDSLMSDGSETKDLADNMDFSKDDEIPMNHLGTDFGARDSNSDEFMEEVESKREIPTSSVLQPGDILLTKKGPLAIPEGRQIDFQNFDLDNSDFGSFTDPKSYSKKFDGIFDTNDFSESEFLTHKQIEKERKRKNHQKRNAEYHEQKSDRNRQKLIYNTYISPDNNTSSFAACPDILKKFNFKRNDVSNTSKSQAEKPEKVAKDTALDKDAPLPDGWSSM